MTLRRIEGTIEHIIMINAGHTLSLDHDNGKVSLLRDH